MLEMVLTKRITKFKPCVMRKPLHGRKKRKPVVDVVLHNALYKDILINFTQNI